MKEVLTGAGAIVLAGIVLYVLGINDDGTPRSDKAGAETTTSNSIRTSSPPTFLPDVAEDAITSEQSGDGSYYSINGEVSYRTHELKDAKHSWLCFLEKWDGNLWHVEFPEVPEQSLIAQVAWDWGTAFWGSPDNPEYFRTYSRGKLYEIRPRTEIREWYPNRNEWVVIRVEDSNERVAEFYDVGPDRVVN